jgi:hypothetical protein
MAVYQITSPALRSIQGDGDIIEERRPVSDSTCLALTGSGEVFIRQGESESLTIEADKNIMDYIKVEVHDGTLVLGFNEDARNKNIRPFHRVMQLCG